MLIPLHSSLRTYWGREASHCLKILVVGGGIGGLAAAYCLSQAGHKVTIIESTSLQSKAGAGMQISPNGTRLLRRWGLGEKLAEMAVEPQRAKFRRYENGRIISHQNLGESMQSLYGAPYYQLHRADLHDMLLALVSSLPDVEVLRNSSVEYVDPYPKPQVTVTLRSGSVISGDLIVGADGLKSILRSAVMGQPDRAEPTGDVAYRTIISTEVLRKDNDLKCLVETPEINVWMGPGRHIVGYSISAGREYNLVMVIPDDGYGESRTNNDSIEKLCAEFSEFEPCVRKLLLCISTVSRWRLLDCKPLETWIHPGERLVLLGDSCHPMLPHSAQGAVMAIEDAAVLGSLFSRLSSPSNLSQTMHAYEALRKERTTKTQAVSRNSKHVFHLPDGPEQQLRDLRMHEASKRELQGLAGILKSEQYAYDADDEVDRWCKDEGNGVK